MIETKETAVRFSDALWAKGTKQDIFLVGAGGIGSWTALFLARTGVYENLIIQDDDKVAIENIGGQLYGLKDVGKLKVMALTEHLEYFSEADNIFTLTDRVILSDESKLDTPVVISAVDNMTTRKSLFKSWCNDLEDWKDAAPIFIDGRMRAEGFQIFFVTPNRIEEYKETLFDDEEVEDEPCSYRATSHFAAMLGARITQGYTNYIVNFDQEDDLFEVPFVVEEHGNLFTTVCSDKLKMNNNEES